MRIAILTSLLLVSLLGSSCLPGSDFDSRLRSIVRPYLFSIARWESTTIPHEVGQWFFGEYQKTDDEIQTVIEYFSAIKRIKTLQPEIAAAIADNREADLAPLEAELNRLQERKLALQETVERIIEKQVREILTQQGIFNPVDEYLGAIVNFPPMNFQLERPPYLLVISPRDRIESIREITLRQDLSLEEMKELEARVDELGISSLVVKLGGFGGTYPTLVTNEASLRFTLDAVAEEWLHQYLTFKPLGFQYLLDITGASRDYEIATINETLASMVSKEIGSIIYEKYYSRYQNSTPQDQPAAEEFDFDQEMREIRIAVDAYLTRGEIEQAEQFMEQKRQYLASMGHHIRKLNQAYFAFHGTYADSPTSISPIGVELRQLRAQSPSLKDFLDTVAAMTSRQQLRDSIK